MRFVVDQLGALQFRWAYRVVDTRAFGLPQRRRRVIIVASRKNDPRQVLLSDNDIGRSRSTEGKACGFYWTEGNTGLGWAVNAVPPLKRGSAFGIASPPAIWRPDERIVTPNIRDAERLQGFPPGWTNHGAGEPPVSVRWHLLGNAVSVPVSRWLGRRLMRPKTYNSEDDSELRAEARWPSAAWSMGGSIYASSVTEYPVSHTYRELDRFLRFPPAPLSSGATAGFLQRAKASRLRFAPGFLEALESHLRTIRQGGD